jgi:hypothetical protein
MEGKGSRNEKQTNKHIFFVLFHLQKKIKTKNCIFFFLKQGKVGKEIENIQPRNH